MSPEDLAPLSAREIASRSAAAMWEGDAASRLLGMELVETGPGRARMTMRVRPDMLNGVGTAHGGVIFALADSTFAFACNSYNERTVAQHCAVTFHAPGREGDLLTAEAREVRRAGRSGLYDIDVTNAEGVLIASFRGHSRTIKGSHFEA
ncbi:hydroxyphenylacetyl-CoA thioesterase PaaI [Paroceanicella profunda]|uniref:Hydroxyphenylacetyl-CoA thioesterase PaaI n=1 Tax=Paroceanicella profunda TaxID=2579971 RepID=A0A5B8FT63_9RHOB|nr:hydroxyphenylacetyl-CoA thioesterase PaaI [Paroceanicella profunda]QDL91936.1 hydroxyphenylacetyl-CoA thioesterase PaaI [Paroceanicella profunda]